MNKALPGLLVSSLLTTAFAYAEVNPNDTAATLSVTGEVTHVFSCAVNLSKQSVSLNKNADDLHTQNSALASDILDVVDITVDGDAECSEMALNQQIAYKLLGTADNADGISLANNDLSEGAAKGIGINLYDIRHNHIVRVNQDNLNTVGTTAHLGLGLVKLTGQEVTAGSLQSSLVVQIERL